MRRICIGTVYRDGFAVVRGSLSWQRCLSVNWRGEMDWCQPWQFADERLLQKAVRLRLQLAGLRGVKFEIRRAEHGEYDRVECVVERLRRPHERAVRINRMWQSGKAEMKNGGGHQSAATPMKSV